MKKTTIMILMLLIATAAIVVGCTNAPTLNGNNPGASIPSVTDNAATPPVSIDNATTPLATDNAANPPATDNASAPNTLPSTTPDQVKELRLEAYKFGFRVLNDVVINKGDHVKITVTSTDGTHGLALPDFNVNISPINQGETKSAEFIADKSGTFTYFCNVPCGPGHSSMVGTLVVN
jgi:cytochrome c oxidase subunit 2